MGVLNEQSFVKRREPDWIRLNQLADRASVSPKNLTEEEVIEFFRLYKRVSGDLAFVRTKSTNVQLAQFLNDLCAKAYAALYRARPKGFLAALGEAVAAAAQTVRRRKAAVLCSLIVFVGSGLFAYLTPKFAPETRDAFMPPGFQDMTRHWREGEMEKRGLEDGLAGVGFYASNNPFVSIITGSIAASTFGVGSARLLFQNGAMLGALTLELEPVGRIGYLYVHVLPHGVPELSGIVLSGAAGFVMGWALIAPGRRTRLDSLKEASKDAVVLLATSVVLMFIAAPIEAFFSFNAIFPNWMRVAMIVVELVAWGLFWIGFAQDRKDAEPAVLRASLAR